MTQEISSKAIMIMFPIAYLMSLLYFTACDHTNKESENSQERDNNVIVIGEKYNSELFDQDTVHQDCCSICLLDYKDKEQIVPLSCHWTHIFHLRCIQEWLKNRCNCPLYNVKDSISMPFDYIKEELNPSFKTVLITELLIGGIILLKTLSFAKYTAEKYRLQALGMQKRQEKLQVLTHLRKKVLKHSVLSEDKQQTVMNLSLGELQRRLLDQYIESEGKEGNIEPINIEDVTLCYLKRLLSQQSQQDSTSNLFGDANFKLVVEQAKAGNAQIQEIIKNYQEMVKSEKVLKEYQKASLQNQEEEIKEEQKIDSSFQNQMVQGNDNENSSLFEIDIAPQSVVTDNPDIEIQEDKKKSPYTNLLAQKPLLGLLLSVGDSIQVKSLSSSFGIIQEAFYQESESCDLVHQIQKYGGIILMKSNQSQLQSPFSECNNFVWGQPSNPWNKKRIVGTSSDSAIVINRLSNLGIAEDILGEQRINAVFNGAYAFCPSQQRIPNGVLDNKRVMNQKNIKGQPFINGRVCFIGRKVLDIQVVFEVLLRDSFDNKVLNRQPQAIKLQFDEDKFYSEKQLKIGYFDSQSLFESCTSVKRAILTSYGHLTSYGYDLVKITQDLPYIDEILEISLNLYFNMNLLQNKTLKEEEHCPQLKALLSQIQTSFGSSYNFKRMFYKSLSKRQKLVQKAQIKLQTAGDLLQKLSDFKKYKELAQQAIHDQFNCDIYLCPAFPLVAPQKDHYLHNLLPAFALTLYWNVLEMPSGIVPQGLVNSDETSYKDNIGDSYEYYAKHVMKDSAGLPIGIQIVGKPNQDETVLRVMRELADKIKFKIPFQFDQ